ncbi:MAG: signal recognition particle-docking protein FtsY [Clostridiales bacterium]|nr:signal recognition particle-docking protein FtsY [Clostridiales bacterium]
MLKIIFAKLSEGLNKTKHNITDRIDDLIFNYGKIDEELLEEIEEILITADVGMNTTLKIISELRTSLKERKINESSEIKSVLKDVLISHVALEEESKIDYTTTPQIILVIGVNGAGKTTSIGKMAKKYKDKNKSVLLVAGDTFRAAAIDQLKVWGHRVDVEVISQQEGSDPASVIYDGIQAAKSRGTDVLICDTAGRLHNKKNLVMELNKVFRIVEREYPEAKREVLLVLDATTGQNAIIQAKTFKEVADITGIILTKLDGTAKGGAILAVKDEVGIPVKLVGLGEKIEDLEDFDGETFIKALID